MITVHSFFSDTLNTVDSVIGDFVSMAYQHFINANANTITLLFTMYVIFLGYQFLFQPHHYNLSRVIRHMVVMLSVYGLVMNWQLYHLFVYQIFTKEPGNIAHILVNSAGQYRFGGDIADALNGVYELVIKASAEFFGQVSFTATGIAFIFYGLLVFLIGSILCVFALLLFLYAKMMMAIALALGPIFLLFILWEPTKGLFSAWLNQLITLALIPIITSAILVLMLSVIHITLPNLDQPMSNLQFYGIAPFLGLSLATTLILSQVFRVASSLGGGITLASLSAGATIASSILQKAVMPLSGRSIHKQSYQRTQFRKRSGEV